MVKNLNMYPEAVAAEFRAEAARQRMNNTRIAECIGSSRQAVCGQLSGKQNLSLMSMVSLSAAVQLPLSEIIARAEAALPAADTPAPHEPQPTVPTTDRSAA